MSSDTIISIVHNAHIVHLTNFVPTCVIYANRSPR